MAAADPASKINPPAWSQRHTQQELQAFGVATTTPEVETQRQARQRAAHLRRLLQTSRTVAGRGE